MRAFAIALLSIVISVSAQANSLFKFTAIYLNYLNRQRVSLKECKALSKLCVDEKDKYLCKVSIDMCLKSGFKEEATLTAQKAAEVLKDCPEIWYIYGKLLLLNNQVEEGLRAIERAIDLNPSYTSPYSIATKILVFEERFDEALKLIKKLERANPKEPKVLLLKGFVLEKEGKYKEAEKFIEEYLSRNPEDTEALEIASEIYMNLGKYKRAAESLEKLIEKGRITESILRNLIEAYINSEQYNKAIHILERISKFHTTKNIHTLLTLLYLKINNIKKAEEICKKNKTFPCIFLSCMENRRISVVDLSYSDIVNAAKLSLEFENPQCAIRLFQKALVLKPKDPEIYRSLSSVYSDLLEVERALKDIQIAIALDPDNLDYLFQKCVILERGSRIDESISCLNRVISKRRDPAYLNYLGYMLIVTDRDIDRGIELVKEALKKRPNNPSYIDSLAWGYFKKGRIKEAEKLQQKAFKMMKDNPIIVFHMAEILHSLNRKAEAIRLYKLCRKLLKDYRDISPWEKRQIEERLKALGF